MELTDNDIKKINNLKVGHYCILSNKQKLKCIHNNDYKGKAEGICNNCAIHGAKKCHKINCITNNCIYVFMNKSSVKPIKKENDATY